MEAQKKTGSKKGMVIALAALAVVLAACLALYFNMRPQPVSGSKQITVEVIHKDGSAKDFNLSTDQEYLGPALVEGGVVVDNQDAFGLYILTADGETADGSAQEWWRVSKDGVDATEGADAIAIADGEHYELTFMVGWG